MVRIIDDLRKEKFMNYYNEIKNLIIEFNTVFDHGLIDQKKGRR